MALAPLSGNRIIFSPSLLSFSRAFAWRNPKKEAEIAQPTIGTQKDNGSLRVTASSPAAIIVCHRKAITLVSVKDSELL
jgi:hypothetical protein